MACAECRHVLDTACFGVKLMQKAALLVSRLVEGLGGEVPSGGTKEGFQRLVGYGTAAGGAAVALHWKRAPPGPPEAPTPLTNCPPTEAR